MGGVDNDSNIDAFERAERARALSGDTTTSTSPASSAPSRKELTHAAFDDAVERITFSASAPLPVQLLRTGNDIVGSTRSAIGAPPAKDVAADVSGVRLYPLVERELPKTTRSAGDAIHVGNYVLHAQMSRGADGRDSIAYYTAVRHGRAEFAVGKDSLDTFKAHADTFQQQADHDWGITNARPYEQDSYRMGEHVSNGDFKGAVVENVHAWMHAWGDPVFAAQRVMDIAVATAPEANAARELSEAPRVLPAPTPDEIAAVHSGSIRYVNKVKGDMNCANCAVATDATLAGKPTSALPGNKTAAKDLARAYGQAWSAPTSPAAIEATMKQAGPDSRGIVFGDRPPVNGQPVVGHFFNVANKGGTVSFVDGQSGGPADLHGQGYYRFFLLRTN